MASGDNEDDVTQSFATLRSGTKVSHYEIIERIGSGGMGEVYLALDAKLNRKVALKFLAQNLCRDEECRKRFTREARAAAALDHPNIAAVHEVGDFRGRPFFAMAYVEGQSIQDLIKQGKLSVSDAVDLAMHICEGLNKAHEAGVVHRDIKPGNIIVDRDSRARILDFGLASVSGEERLTKTGSTLGTIHYMSPEQVEGKNVDHRSDLFSVGLILYEMITGRLPFEGDNDAAVIKAISDSTPEPIARFKSGVSGELQQIIDRALDKDPSHRYQHADDMLADLRRLSTVRERSAPSRFALWITGAIVIAVASYIGYRAIVSEEIVESQPAKMLAVLPFENLGDPEDEYFADGVTDEITSRLAKLSALRVISRTSAIQYKGTDKSLPQIANELGVGYILEGTIRWDKAGDTDRVRITPQLIRVEDNTHLWADRYDAVLDDIFSIQSRIAERVAEELDITLLESERDALNEQPTRNTEAYDFYLRGREFFANHTPKDYFNAEEMFQKAIELEPDFVAAHDWLSTTHTQLYAWYVDRTDERLAAAKEEAERAIEIAPDRPDGYAALAWYHYQALGDNDRALEEFTSLREKYPSDAIFNICIALIERTKGEWDKAVADGERAIRLSPRVATFYCIHGLTMHYLRRYAEAESTYTHAIELKPDSRQAHLRKAVLRLLSGDIEATRQVLQEALQKMDRWPDLTSVEAEVEAAAGDYDRALALLEDYGNSSNLDAYDSAHCYQMKGSVCRYSNQTELMESYYDSSRVILERLVSADPDDPWNRTELGLIYAGLGRGQEALREGQLAVKLLPVSEDATNGTEFERNLAEIYCIIGDYDQAIERLDYLLSIPSKVSVPFLKIWPDYAPLRDLPQFKALLEKYEKKHGT